MEFPDFVFSAARGKLVVLVFLLVFLFLLGTASAAEMTIQPDPADGKDAMIRQDNPDRNYGTASVIYVGRTASGDIMRSVFRFNLSVMPENSTIINATFQAYMFLSSTSVNLSMDLRKMSVPWEEGSANGQQNSGSINGTTWWERWYGLNWTSFGGDYNSTPESITNVTNITGWFSWDVTNATKAWYSVGSGNYGFILVSSGAANEYRGFYSSDYATNITLRPRLLVSYVSNLPPVLINVSDDSNQTNPTAVGALVNFSAYWNDEDSDVAKLFVCNTSGINYSGCQAREFCSTSYSSSPLLQCSYSPLDSDAGNMSYWAAVCDNDGNCSAVSSQYDFRVNHYPLASVQYPNGGEYINQTAQGNYTITFQVSDKDNDNLTASIYYSVSAGNRTNLIAGGLQLNSTNCVDPDGRTNTTNNCTYSWNSSGIVGQYWMDVYINDSRLTGSDSSNSSFNVQSLIDSDPPSIWNESITENLTSGEMAAVRANASDPHIRNVWVELNDTAGNKTNVTMYVESGDIFLAYFEAKEAGTWGYRVHVDDMNSNENYTAWNYFNVSKPQAEAQGENYPNIALPSSVISIKGNLNATDLINMVNATLNIDANFSFNSGYSRTQIMGNFSEGQVKQVFWILSASYAEGFYIFNITYADKYGNVWTSQNHEIQLTTALGGIFVDINSQVEVAAGESYMAEILVRDGNGNFVDPDGLLLTLRDPLGNAVVENVNYTNQVSTGIFNYTYATGAGQPQGHWVLVANATYYGNYYIDRQFWKLVGGPFDVRNITVNDNTVDLLSVSVILENMGDVGRDMTVVWNLTREDTGELLDSGADTVMVPASTAITHTVYPSTSYVGAVKIVFLGYYSVTETAGAFETFDTQVYVPVTPPGGGPSGGPGGPAPPAQAKLEILSFPKELYLYPGQTKVVDLIVRNAGGQGLEGVSLELEGIDAAWYKTSPPAVIGVNASRVVSINFTIPVGALVSSYPFSYVARSGSTEARELANLHVVSEAQSLYQQMIEIRDRIYNIKYTIDAARQKGYDVSEPAILARLAEGLLPGIEESISFRDLGRARKDLALAADYVDQAEKKLKELGVEVLERPVSFLEAYGLWVVTWGMIILIVLSMLMLRRSLSKGYRRDRDETPRQRDERFNYRIRKIREKMRRRSG